MFGVSINSASIASDSLPSHFTMSRFDGASTWFFRASHRTIGTPPLCKGSGASFKTASSIRKWTPASCSLLIK